MGKDIRTWIVSDDLEADGDDSHVVGSTLTNLAAGGGGLAEEQSKRRSERLGGPDNGEGEPQFAAWSLVERRHKTDFRITTLVTSWRVRGWRMGCLLADN